MWNYTGMAVVVGLVVLGLLVAKNNMGAKNQRKKDLTMMTNSTTSFARDCTHSTSLAHAEGAC